jgi:hypothetical protein
MWVLRHWRPQHWRFFGDIGGPDIGGPDIGGPINEPTIWQNVVAPVVHRKKEKYLRIEEFFSFLRN